MRSNSAKLRDRAPFFAFVFCAACASSSPPGPPRSGGGAGMTGGAGQGSAMGGTSGTPAGSGGAAAGTGARNDSGGASPSGGSAGTTATAGAGAGGIRATGGSPSGGQSATGGDESGSAGTGGQAGAPNTGPFVLAWQDEFDTLDASAWQLQTFTFDGNEAQFSTQNAAVSDGVLTISLTNAASGAAKPYLGVEMRSSRTLTYGKVSARMRFAAGSGVVSSLVLFYTPFPNCDWNEIDIEHLGKSATSSQLNAMVYLGTPDPNCTTSVTPTQDPQVVDLGFNAETDFHVYDIEWTPESVKYFADGKQLRTWTANIAHLTLPETILLTIWASSATDWAGPLGASSAPTSADVDWIKVYDYVAPKK